MTRRTDASVRWRPDVACLLSLAVTAGCAGTASQPEVVAYVAVDRKDSEPILRQFESQTGIRVRALYDGEAAKTTGLVTRLISESKRPRCDVFWNNEIVQTIAIAERGLLQSYRPADTETIPENCRDPNDLWTGLGTRARVIVYNTRLLAAHDVPATLDELTLPKWKGKVAIANPLFGTTRTHVAALYATWGPDKTQKWLQALLDNEVRIVDGNAMVKNLVARADPDASPIVIGLTDTDDVFSGKAEGLPLEYVYPDQKDLGTLVIPTTVCLLKNAPNQEAGRRLLDFLTRRDVESRLAGPGSGYRRVRTDSDLPHLTAPRAMEVSYDAIHAELRASTEWVSGHFHN